MGKFVKISDLSRFGNHLARAIRRNLKWSKQLSKSVVLSKVKEGKNVSSISVSVGSVGTDKSGNALTGMARAYEYGSGLHATRKGRKKYTIEAKNKPYLKFFWKKKNKIFRGLSVQHPGVEQREYIKKSFEEVRKKATDELSLSIRNNVAREISLIIREVNNAHK